VLLGRYLRCRARDVAFTFRSNGKPGLQGESRLQFNMSHSDSLAVYAFTTDCEIGIDTEKVREIADANEIAARYFCRAEALELFSIADQEARQEAFFRCWTRKEAYIKAVGDGLYMPLDRFQVTLSTHDHARVVHISNDEKAASEWTLQHIEPAPGYTGAVAFRAGGRAMLVREAEDANLLVGENAADWTRRLDVRGTHRDECRLF
jgi:4'-phosphopantetheinyl transferase